ncbi:MAG: hypothetical protein ACE5HE_03070 [Phycisphaerae bacterium]
MNTPPRQQELHATPGPALRAKAARSATDNNNPGHAIRPSALRCRVVGIGRAQIPVVGFVILLAVLNLGGIAPFGQSIAEAGGMGAFWTEGRRTRGRTSEPVPDAPGQDTSTDESRRLGQKLIRSVRGGVEDDVMETILRLMDSAARRLTVDLDGGRQTQAMQREIMEQLDAAIKIAGVRRLTRSRTPQPPRGDKRRREDRKSPDSARGADKAEAKEDSASSAETVEAGRVRRQGNRRGGSMFESRRTWGQLPPRQRDEVIQGLEEQYLERFRAWIEQYYRALQNSNDADVR